MPRFLKNFTFFLTLAILLSGCSDTPEKTTVLADYGVYHASISLDGRYGIVATVDNDANLWDLQNGTLKHTWKHRQGDANEIINTAISPTGQLALTLEHRTFAIWNVQSGQTLRYWQMPSNILSIKVSVNNRFALTGMMDHTARYLDLGTGAEVTRFFHQGNVEAVALSMDGRYALTGSADTTVKLWEIHSGRKLAEYPHKAAVTALAISDDNRYVFSAAGQYESYVWDTSTGKAKYKLSLRGKWAESLTKSSLTISAASFSHDSTRLITTSPPNFLRVWDVETGKVQQEIVMPKRNFWKPGGSVIYAVTTNADDSIATTIGSDGLSHQWRLSK